MEVVGPARFCGYCGEDVSGQSGAQGGSSGGSVSAPPQAYLQMVVGSEIDRQYPLKGVMYVGRELDNDIQVIDPRVSRRHARIRADGTRVTVADLGSTNGTLVNDVPITGEYVLHDGDVLRMGHSEWAFGSTFAPSAARRAPRRSAEAGSVTAYPPRQATAARANAKEIIDGDELPWSAIAIVVGGLIIGFSICCIAAVFIMSR